MANQIISLFDNIKQTTKGKEIEISTFLENIRDGRWQDIVLPLRAIKDKRKRSEAKEKVPYVTVSGKFNDRSIKGLISHSGFICIDIDEIDVEEVKRKICNDKYVYAAYTSISGNGLAVLFKIDETRHEDAFEGLQEYLFNQYGIIIDYSCRDVSRARYISFDPNLFENDKAAKFKQYLKKKAPAKIEKIVFAPGDFEDIISQIEHRGINICEAYSEWLRCGFALAHKFQEDGRAYFHAISQFSAKYEPKQCDKQYDCCIKSRNAGTTIATLYYYFKQAGLELYSDRTKLIATSATAAWKGGKTVEDTINNLQKHEGLTPDQTTEIVKQVIDNKIEIKTEDSQFALIKLWLRHNYDFRRNTITHYIENSGKPMKDEDFNSIYCKYKEIDEKFNYQDLLKIILSDFVPDYNPLKEFIEANKNRPNTNAIANLCKCVKTNNQYFEHFFKKWLVGIIASIYGGHCRLMLVFTGGQNIGKSEFFIRLLPDELKEYFSTIKWDKGKDDEITLTRKVLVLDDELESHNKKTNGQMKATLSAQSFFIRLPYGKSSIDIKRLAVLCGTSNPTNILTDATGNTRIIPVNITSIDFDGCNAINKIDLLIEAYNLYGSGETCNLSKEDALILNGETTEFENYTLEYELINKYYKVPEPGSTNIEKITASDIKIEIERQSLNRNLSIDYIGKELHRIGFIQKTEKINGKAQRLYSVEKLHPLHPFTPI